MKLPKVSLVMVARNCEEAIEYSLESYAKLDYPRHHLSLLIVDGESDDQTLCIAKTWAKNNKDKFISIKFYKNPKKTLAAGWNIAIQNSNDPYILRIDAHSQIDSQYLILGVNFLEHTSENCAAVGGVIKSIPRNQSKNSRSISSMLSSRLATGTSPFRNNTSNESFQSDTAVFAVYRRSAFIEGGNFDEDLPRTQDIDFHSRLKKLGKTIYTNPFMKAEHMAPGTIKDLMKKAYRTGYWTVKGGTGHIRHYIPHMFALYFYTLIVGSFFLSEKILWLYSSPLLAYLLLPIYCTFFGPKLGVHSFLLPLFHISYGTGGLFGAVSSLSRRLIKS